MRRERFMSLCDLAIRHAQPKDKEYKLFDTGGLYVAVRPTGAKVWRLKYYFYGKERKATIGIYPIITLVKAREKRDLIKQDVIDGIDPSETKAEKKRKYLLKKSQTFELLAREWHKRYYDTWNKRYADELLTKLENNVFPFFGKMPISEVTTEIATNCIRIIEDRGASDQAVRVTRIIGQVMRYGTQTGRAEKDFTPDMKGAVKRYKTGHYACITKKEIPEFLKVLYANEARLFKQTLISIKLLMLTAVRTRELIEAKWTEFDFPNKVWIIPAERMKNKLEHLVPLSRQVLLLLDELKTLNGKNEFILPSICRSKKPMNNNTILKALDALGYGKKMTGHGFRSLFMSTLKEETKSLDFRHEVIDRQLSHVAKDKVEQAYDRAEYDTERTQLMQIWADYIDKVRPETT